MIELSKLRYTPAGVAAVEFRIHHESEQDEAGGKRQVQAEIDAIAFEAQAKLIAGTQANTAARFQGFLGAKSQRSRKIVMHVTNIEFIEGDSNAPATQR